MDFIRMNIYGIGLDKKDLVGLSDPFIVISRIEENGSHVKVYETNVIKNTLNPQWEDIHIPERDLNNGNINKMILFEVYDWDLLSGNDIIGVFQASLKMILEKKEFELINEDERRKKGNNYKNSGIIQFSHVLRYKN